MKIKMFEKAKEIQELWKPKYGDRVQIHVSLDNYGIGFLSIDDAISIYYPERNLIQDFEKINTIKELFFWLPTQEQLQNIICIVSRETIDYVLMKFDKFEKRTHATYNNLNEMWLGCVMVEIFGKEWNGEEWI